MSPDTKLSPDFRLSDEVRLSPEIRLALSDPNSSLSFPPSNDVLKQTVVVIPFLEHGFQMDESKVTITALADVTILPVAQWAGSDIKKDELQAAFYGGYLGLYTPQRKDGDHIVIEITEGLKKTKPTTHRAVLRFGHGKWGFVKQTTLMEIPL